jgi:hypothetical protein
MAGKKRSGAVRRHQSRQKPMDDSSHLIPQLKWLGWLRGAGLPPSSRQIKQAVRCYQRWAGLKTDAIAGPVTMHHLRRPRICGTPDMVQQQGQLCRWPHKKITWAVLSQLPGVSLADFRAAAEWAMGRWAAVCDISPAEVGRIFNPPVRNRAKQADGLKIRPTTAANITLSAVNLGGPGGVLADSMLPCGATARSTMRQRYDTSELWHAGEGKPPNGRVSLRAVVLHELGHALGIDHLAPNGPTGVMQPYYRDDVLDLLPPDVEQAVRRYGEPKTKPPAGEAAVYRLTFTSASEPQLERAA